MHEDKDSLELMVSGRLNGVRASVSLEENRESQVGQSEPVKGMWEPPLVSLHFHSVNSFISTPYIPQLSPGSLNHPLTSLG